MRLQLRPSEASAEPAGAREKREEEEEGRMRDAFAYSEEK